MALTYLHVFPVIVFIWFPISFLITYIIAISLDHINPLTPYISDTGTYAPESCIFGQLISIGLIFIVFVLYIRYRQVRELYHNYNLPYTVQKLNQVTFSFGLLASLGISIVGHFQETNCFVVHLVGAFMGFGLGTIYIVLQTVISFKLFPMTGKLWILYTRIVLSVTCSAAFIICFMFGCLSLHEYKGDITRITKWSPEDGGWVFHVISVTAEWIVAMDFMTFILTFSQDFHAISISEPTLHIEEALLNQNERVPVT